MEITCSRKIKELHVFIESWLKGSVEKNKMVFKYFEDELNNDFIIIQPNGKPQTKENIISGFWEAYGVRSTEFKIEIRNINNRLITDNICILTYEEWQIGEEKSGRLSTAVFKKPLNSNHYYWFHLHENWIT